MLLRNNIMVQLLLAMLVGIAAAFQSSPGSTATLLIGAASLSFLWPRTGWFPSLTIAIPSVVNVIIFEHFPSILLRLIAVGLFLGLVGTGFLTGRVVERLYSLGFDADAAARHNSPSMGIRAEFWQFGVILLVGVLSWLLVGGHLFVEQNIALLWVIMALIVVSAASIYPDSWLELGGSGGLPVLYMAILNRSSLLPFEFGAAAIWALPLIPAAWAGKVLRIFFARAGSL